MRGHAQAALSDVDALLLDVYLQIDEPDGMYAAARSQQAASQLALFEHEGAWDKALVSCDLMLPRGLASCHPGHLGFKGPIASHAAFVIKSGI